MPHLLVMTFSVWNNIEFVGNDGRPQSTVNFQWGSFHHLLRQLPTKHSNLRNLHCSPIVCSRVQERSQESQLTFLYNTAFASNTDSTLLSVAAEKSSVRYSTPKRGLHQEHIVFSNNSCNSPLLYASVEIIVHVQQHEPRFCRKNQTKRWSMMGNRWQHR